MKFKLHQPTIDLLDGLRGIELGAGAHNPFGVDAINVAPQRPDDQVFKRREIELCGEFAPVDMKGHAADIPVETDSVDFVLSSHVLEHAPDLLAALAEIDRVVKPEGYVVIIFPQPNALPDDDRPLSKIDDIWEAYYEGWTWDTAPERYIPGGHYWKMTCTLFKKLIESLYRKNSHRDWPGLKWKLVGEEDPDTKVGNGFWLAYHMKE